MAHHEPMLSSGSRFSLSPLYSNIYLNLLDQVWYRLDYPAKLGASLHRYADDALLVCRGNAEDALLTFEVIALRRGLLLNRGKTRITRLTEGFDFPGLNFVKRRSPNTGKNTICISPGKASQHALWQRLRAFTKRRAPIPVADFVRQVNQTVRGWVNCFRHTNASKAFRDMQRFINSRFRRYLTFQHKGRGFGWRRFPNKTLYAKGIIYIGSRIIRYPGTPAHVLR